MVNRGHIFLIVLVCVFIIAFFTVLKCNELLTAQSITIYRIRSDEDLTESITIFDRSVFRRLWFILNTCRWRSIDDNETIEFSYPLIGFSINTDKESQLVLSDGYIIYDSDVFKTKPSVDRIDRLLRSLDLRYKTGGTFPCLYVIATVNGQWNKSFINASRQAEEPSYSAKITYGNNGMFQLELTNPTESSVSYDPIASVQVLLENDWYDIPVNDPALSFHAIAYTLEPGEIKQLEYSVNEIKEMYKLFNLPGGKYRIKVCSCCFYFEE